MSTSECRKHFMMLEEEELMYLNGKILLNHLQTRLLPQVVDTKVISTSNIFLLCETREMSGPGQKKTKDDIKFALLL
jgi:hypothetical protein